MSSKLEQVVTIPADVSCGNHVFYAVQNDRNMNVTIQTTTREPMKGSR